MSFEDWILVNKRKRPTVAPKRPALGMTETAKQRQSAGDDYLYTSYYQSRRYSAGADETLKRMSCQRRNQREHNQKAENATPRPTAATAPTRSKTDLQQPIESNQLGSSRTAEGVSAQSVRSSNVDAAGQPQYGNQQAIPSIGRLPSLRHPDVLLPAGCSAPSQEIRFGTLEPLRRWSADFHHVRFALDQVIFLLVCKFFFHT